MLGGGVGWVGGWVGRTEALEPVDPMLWGFSLVENLKGRPKKKLLDDRLVC